MTKKMNEDEASSIEYLVKYMHIMTLIHELKFHTADMSKEEHRKKLNTLTSYVNEGGEIFEGFAGHVKNFTERFETMYNGRM
jgi:hypothetical protein